MPRGSGCRAVWWQWWHLLPMELGERHRAAAPRGSLRQAPSQFCGSVMGYSSFLKVKNLNQPYYISVIPARLETSVLQPSSVESIQARQDDLWLAAIFTHINHAVHELKLSRSYSLNQANQVPYCLWIWKGTSVS